ncbi:alpha/beta-hydrolase [Saitoella complicata NRRL Y-17804]|uniref:Carboxypeptidase n=1 Tax=Saitoella complicata (strain BCRC 22490 / CBS 7301 / JCM 7358 / NBRC 10748 / NRRL Y-17804) TaxID=698492 RepID=A0A0E9NQ35_SAICN|nr:alpha/beta-hydrolase [Saitoella complicata NRRL Y-17804]ODQ54670.1 alpha/beta-hydrolase [Saitoella complicata NRRL Y-17804]GAO51903.1 hypothetical protein G7K_5991-t1 [Saitoella complicata NRRL Y-17804]
MVNLGYVALLLTAASANVVSAIPAQHKGTTTTTSVKTTSTTTSHAFASTTAKANLLAEIVSEVKVLKNAATSDIAAAKSFVRSKIAACKTKTASVAASASATVSGASAIASVGSSTYNKKDYLVSSLPDVSFSLPTSYAGLLPTEKNGDDNIFFWYFQNDSDDLVFWLNGGPGCSSLVGLFEENGPLEFGDGAVVPSARSLAWTNAASMVYIDQPLGTGFSFGPDSTEEDLLDNDAITARLYGWFEQFFTMFPELLKKDVTIMGESYAGVYVPYIADKIQSNLKTLPIKMKAISVGDGLIGNYAANQIIPVAAYMNEQNDTLKVDQVVLDVMNNQSSYCGFDSVLAQVTYPPSGPINGFMSPPDTAYKKRDLEFEGDLAKRATYTDAEYFAKFAPYWWGMDGAECDLYSVALGGIFQQPYSTRCFDVYNIDHDCNNTVDNSGYTEYLLRDDVRAALHIESAPAFQQCNDTIQNIIDPGLFTPTAYEIIPRLSQEMEVHIYSGKLDFAINHLGTEMVLQNTTWGGKQGFQKKPNTKLPFGGGVFRRERGLTYTKFDDAGHLAPEDAPETLYQWFNKFVLKNYAKYY